MTIMMLLKRVDCNDGVATYLESLVTGLRELGDQVVIVSGNVTTHFGSQERRRRIEAAALDWIVLDDLSLWRRLPGHVRRVLAIVDKYGVDVVSPQGFGIVPIATLAGRLKSKPVVTNFHLLPPCRSGGAWGLVRSAMSQLAYRVVNAVCRSDRYIAMSTDIARFFHEYCGIPQRIIRIQMLGVDTSFYRVPTQIERRAARRRFGLSDSTLVAVLPGRLNATKGHDVAAAAFRILRDKRPQLSAICLFAGDGDQRQMIEADVVRDENDRSAFTFLGFVDRDTMREAYWAADIVLLPSRSEGFPLVIIEAMNCGAIVIRTPTSGWQDQVEEGKTGYVVPFDDPVALAEAIGKIADSRDRDAMRRAAALLASTQFSKPRMVVGTAAIYRESVDIRQAPRRDSIAKI